MAAVCHAPGHSRRLRSPARCWPAPRQSPRPTRCAGADTPAAAGNEAQLDQATLCLLNEQRASMGLAALTENHQLDQTSTAFSRQMVAESFFDHTSPEGETLVDRLTAIGYLPGQGSWARVRTSPGARGRWRRHGRSWSRG